MKIVFLHALMIEICTKHRKVYFKSMLDKEQCDDLRKLILNDNCFQDFV